MLLSQVICPSSDKAAAHLTFSRSMAFIAPSMPFTTFAILPVT